MMGVLSDRSKLKGEQQQRTRKRLSIRGPGNDNRRSSVSTVAESVVASSEVQTIYETCSQMFNANRISPQNAFNLKLLDCINQMINSPNYDKGNMQLTSSTVEIGTKIFVCRVDNAHSQVLSLASDVNLQQQRKKKKDGTEADNQQQDGDGIQNDDGGLDDDEEGGRRQKAKKRVIKKRGKFIEEDNSKLLTGLEEQNVKFVTRRNLLKKKFTEMIYDDMDFNYASHFVENEDENPLQTEDERLTLKSKSVIPDAYVNPVELTRLDFLPFHHVNKFDPEIHELWGRALNEVEVNRDASAVINDGPNTGDAAYAYDPNERPAEYADEGVPDMNDSFGDVAGGAFAAAEDGEEVIPAVSFHDIRGLNNLENYFNQIKKLLKENKSKYGWCGPNFVRPKSTWATQQKGAKKPKTKKEPERIDFMAIDWSDKSNKFAPNHQSARTVFDDKVIEEWSNDKVVIPFLGVELNTFEDDMDPTDMDDESDPHNLPQIFKLFSSRYTSILELMNSEEKRRRHDSNASKSTGAPDIGDDGFDQDGHDIELPREMVDDFCSQPTNDEGFNRPDGSAPTEAGWQFPASVPGLLNNDPLTQVSDVDSIRFSRKPKPIDMSALKKAIFKILSEKLCLDPSGIPLKEEETSVDLAELMFLVLQQVGVRTEKLMSVPIFIVALMHVVADRRLFVIPNEKAQGQTLVICRGKNFNHADFIPISKEGLDMD